MKAGSSSVTRGGRPKRLGPEDAVPAGWSQDGKWIYFDSNRSGGEATLEDAAGQPLGAEKAQSR